MAAYKTTREKSRGNSSFAKFTALIAVFCILASIAIIRDGRIFSYAIYPTRTLHDNTVQAEDNNASGQRVINTTEAGKDITGYNGTVPLLIYVSGQHIDSVRALPNQETPNFFKRASKLLHSWDGMSINEAADAKVDAMSGATYSSNAITGNFKAGLATIEKTDASAPSPDPWQWAAPYIFALIVALSAAVLPLFIKNKTYRLIQQVMNVGVLGFWTGTFLDYSVFLRVFSAGLPFTMASILTLLLFVTAFVFPLFGKANHYCAWVCPFGSLQELIHKEPAPRLQLTPAIIKGMATFRNIL